MVSRVLGFAKSVLLVACIGGTSSAPGGQIFDLANTLPTAAYALVAGGALSSILIPEITRAIHREQQSGVDLGETAVDSREHVDQILSIVTFAGGALTVVLLVLAPCLISVYAVAWPESWLQLGATMAVWCIPQVFFLVLFGTLSQVLLAHGRFGFVAWAPALSNTISIASLLVFLAVVPSGLVGVEKWTPSMVGLVCGGALLGAVAQSAIVVLPVARIGHRLRLRLRPSRFTRIGAGVLWGFLGVVCWQGSYILVSNVSSAAGARLTAWGVNGASLNSLSNAYLLLLLPHGVIAVSLITASYSRISHSYAADDVDRGWVELRRTARLVTYVCALSTAVFVALGPLMGVAVWNARPVGTVLAALGLGLVPLSLTVLVQRVSYVVGDTRSPFYIQLVASGVTAVGVLLVGLLVPAHDVVVAVALVISGSTWVGLLCGLALLGRRGEFRARFRVVRGKAARRAGRLVLLAAVSASCGWAASHVLPDVPESVQGSAIVKVAISALIVGVVYAGLGHVLGERSAAEVVRAVIRRP